MKKLILAASLVAAGAASAAAVDEAVIYDTFNEEDQANLFDCCQAWPVSTQKSQTGYKQSVAIPFTPKASGRVKEVDIALSWVSGETDLLTVSIRGDINGLPGALKGRSVNAEAPAEGQCCSVVGANLAGVVVEAGRQYWIEVDAHTNSFGGWNLNTLGKIGAVATMGEHRKWGRTSDTLPAVRLYMK